MSIDYNSLLKQYRDNGVIIDVKNGDLSVKAPRGALSQEQVAFLKLHKKEIVDSLQLQAEQIPLTDIQSAYYLGRTGGFAAGDIPCQVYLELDYDELDIDQANEAVNQVIKKHEMLRAVIEENGAQRILKSVPEYKMDYWEERNKTAAESDEFETFRKKHVQWSSQIGKWPFFDIAVSTFSDKSVLHLAMDFIIADWASVWILVQEFEKYYYGNKEISEEVNLTFREYVRLESEFKATSKYKSDKKYWNDRMNDFPGAPKIAVCEENIKNTFTRKIFELDSDKWERFKKKALSYNCTPTVALLTIYGLCLSRWSENSRFGINVTMLNRMPLHEDVNKIIGDFTSVTLLETQTDDRNIFIENMKQVQAQLNADLDHNSYSGVKVLRDLSKVRGQENSMYPLVFTGSIGLGGGDGLHGRTGGYGISQTPQVYIDCQAMDSDTGLRINWDIREGVFKEEVINALFDTFKNTISKLVEQEESWEASGAVKLPAYQLRTRENANNTDKKIEFCPLHWKFFENVEKGAEKIAVIDENGSYTYGQIAKWAIAISTALKEANVKKGDKVGILLSKGAYQIAAVMGILAAGATYVPLDEKQPDNRIATIIEKTGIYVVVASQKFENKNFDAVRIYGEEFENKDVSWSINEVNYAAEKDIAYIIYTSGSTGIPKGVEISHKAANNTIHDINERFGIGEDDKVIALSRLNFDLSVYDIFGLLSVGGSLIFAENEQYLNPKHWYEMMEKYNITVWNTVPSLLVLLLDHLESSNAERLSLKNVFLSGDWIPVSTRKRLEKFNKTTRLIGLGGATEASIWSNFHICSVADDNKASIPYGYPLSNQRFRVLNSQQQDCPDYVVGELYILGTGVARGYCNDVQLTADSFTSDEKYCVPSYRTGDFGYYADNGEIIFCGRKDSQVKVRGHRIELGEIENTLKKNSSVKECVVLTSSEETQNIIAAIVLKEKVTENEIREFLGKYLPEYMVPSEYIFVDEIPLNINGKKDYQKIREHYKEEKKEHPVVPNMEAAREPLEITMCERIGEHLGIVNVGANVNLYEIGADSLILAKFISEHVEVLKGVYPHDMFKFDDLLRQVLSRPTIHELYEFIKIQHEKNGNTEEIKEAEVLTEEEKELGRFTLYGEGKGEIARIIFHAGLGTSNFARFIIPILEQQEIGALYGVTIKNMDRYCETDAEELISQLGREYADHIKNMGVKKVQLIGYCMGGLIASAVACNLTGTEVEIENFLLVDSAPVLYDIGETIALELVFITNYFITVEDVYHEITNAEIMDAIMYVFNTKKSLNEKDFEILKSEERYVKAYEFLKRLSEIPTDQRFIDYTNAMAAHANIEMPKEMLVANYKVYVHSFQASKYDAEPYFGDVHFLEAKESLDFIFTDKEETRGYWRDRIFGNFEIDEIPGNHVTCIEDEKNAYVVANWAKKELLKNE